MGGGSTRASNVVKGLLDNNCDVIVITAFPHYPHGNIPECYRLKAMVSERFGKAKVFRVWIPNLPHNTALNRVLLHFCFCFSSLFALPFIGKIDLIWCANPNLFSIFNGLLSAFFKRVPIVRNVDDLWPEAVYELGYVRSDFCKKILDVLAWFSYILPTAITPISDGYKDSIITKYHIPPEKIHVVEVGVESSNALKIKKHSNNQFNLVYSGVLGLGYDFDVVLDAAQLLSNKLDIVFFIRGVGELAFKLKKNIAQRNLFNVVLETHFLAKDELVAFLSSADAFLLPMANFNFVNLGLPTKLFEYQSYGKPVICISSGEPAKYIKSTKSGLIVKPKDETGLVDAIVKLRSDKKLCEKLGTNGRRHVLQNVSTKKIGYRMFSLFRSILLHR